MKIIKTLICYGLRHALGEVATDTAGKGIEFLVAHFTDHSQALPKALAAANHRTWAALAVALSGDGFWEQCKRIVGADQTARNIRGQVEPFLRAAALEQLPKDFREACLAELKQLRASAEFKGGDLPAADFKLEMTNWQRYSDPRGIIEGACTAVRRVAQALEKKYPKLSRLLCHRAGDAPPLLASLFAFFLREEIAKNTELAAALTFDLLRNLYAAQETAFAGMALALAAIDDKLDAILEQGGCIEGKLDFLAELQVRGDRVLLDFMEEQSAHNQEQRVLNQANDEKLHRIEVALAARQRGEHEHAEAIYFQMSREQPEAVVLAVAVAASQTAGNNFVGAAKSLERACRLRPGDIQLAAMSHRATQFSRGATPVDPRPDAIKRPKSGDILGGWLLEKLLGFGGWGQVFRARQGDRVRALKIMHAELSQDPEFVRRFKREMSLLISLGKHPHLIRIDPDHLFDKAEDWGCWYFVMDYVEGATLERYLEKHGALTLDQVRSLFTGLAEGLASAHVRGIIHRDIKSANILIRKKAAAGQGQGVLVDFGLAGLVDPHSRGTGHTARFAAPEQMRDGTSDCRSDVYSFAATIYYCLLYGDSAKHSRFTAKLLPADIPAKVRALLKRCLDNDPKERPKDAGAFVQDWGKPSTAENNTQSQPKTEIVTLPQPKADRPKPTEPTVADVDQLPQSLHQTDWQSAPPPPRAVVVVTLEEDIDQDEPEPRVPRRSRRSRRNSCPYCGSAAEPVIRRKIGVMGWVVFAVFLLVFFPLCFLGLFMTDEVEFCCDCGAKLRTRGQGFGFPN